MTRSLFDGLALQRCHIFGSAAKAKQPEDIVARRTADLAAHWNDFQDWTGKATIGSEWQRYQPFGPSHHMAADRLELVGGLDRRTVRWTGGDFQVTTGTVTRDGHVPGEPTPVRNLGLADTVCIEVAQLIAIQWRGLYRVASVDRDASTVTLLPLCPKQDVLVGQKATKGRVLVLPGFALQLAKATEKGSPLLWFTDIPPSLPASGAMVGWADDTTALQRGADLRITTVNRAARLASLQKPFGAVRPAGSFVLALAPITSAQIWSKAGFDFGKRTWAFEFDVTLPEAGARGAWPAGWFYGKNDASNRLHPHAGDEIDAFEIWYDLLRGADVFSGNTHKRGRLLSDSWFGGLGWFDVPLAGAFYRRHRETLAGRRRIGIRIEPDLIARSVDGLVLKETAFRWENPNAAQLGLNLAVGSFGASNAANCLLPDGQEALDAMRFGIHSVAIYSGS